MNHITITVTAPKGQARSNLAAQVMAGLRSAGFQVGLSDPTPDFNINPGRTFLMDTRVSVVSKEEKEETPDYDALVAASIAEKSELAQVKAELAELKARLAGLEK